MLRESSCLLKESGWKERQVSTEERSSRCHWGLPGEKKDNAEISKAFLTRTWICMQTPYNIELIPSAVLLLESHANLKQKQMTRECIILFSVFQISFSANTALMEHGKIQHLKSKQEGCLLSIKDQNYINAKCKRWQWQEPEQSWLEVCSEKHLLWRHCRRFYALVSYEK